MRFGLARFAIYAAMGCEVLWGHLVGLGFNRSFDHHCLVLLAKLRGGLVVGLRSRSVDLRCR
jgi:hypothetical protein